MIGSGQRKKETADPHGQPFCSYFLLKPKFKGKPLLQPQHPPRRLLNGRATVLRRCTGPQSVQPSACQKTHPEYFRVFRRRTDRLYSVNRVCVSFFVMHCVLSYAISTYHFDSFRPSFLCLFWLCDCLIVQRFGGVSCSMLYF